ncbi:MAG: transglutaminase domain-containing protein [Blautia sp.]|nr:transglutaminase domain-containing protein [Blautia sp.]
MAVKFTPGGRKRGLAAVSLSFGLLLASWYLVHGDSAASARWTAPTGEVISGGKLVIDAGNAADGYFLASVPGGCGNKLKLRVTKDDSSMTYELNQDGVEEVFPLQLGSGDYEISLYENIAEKKFSQEGTVSLSVALSSEDAAFYVPNQYVNYNQASPVVAESDQVGGALAGKAAYDAIQGHVTTGYTYDYIKSVTTEPGGRPDIEGCVANHTGISQDLSATMVAMLRCQGIPAKLVVGYADDIYHAWTVAYVDGQELFFDPSLALDAIGMPKQYTAERCY